MLRRFCHRVPFLFQNRPRCNDRHGPGTHSTKHANDILYTGGERSRPFPEKVILTCERIEGESRSGRRGGGQERLSLRGRTSCGTVDTPIPPTYTRADDPSTR
jgi:hypothetical protein